MVMVYPMFHCVACSENLGDSLFYVHRDDDNLIQCYTFLENTIWVKMTLDVHVHCLRCWCIVGRTLNLGGQSGHIDCIDLLRDDLLLQPAHGRLPRRIVARLTRFARLDAVAPTLFVFAHRILAAMVSESPMVVICQTNTRKHTSQDTIRWGLPCHDPSAGAPPSR